jgi:1,2-diacylglycerol 3-alpha-glucosyltransferase
MERPLRIAVFSDSFLPILNGVSISIDALVTELRNRGHSVHIYTASSPFYKDSDPNTFRFTAFDTPVAKQYPLAFPPFYPMLRRFRRHTYDLIHSHTPFTVGFVGLRWAESHELPIVSTYHTLYDRYAHYIPFLPKRYVRFKIAKHTNFYYNNVDHVITPSDAAMKWLQRHSVTTDISVIPTGAPRRRMMDRSEVRQSLGIPPEQRILLYVGRLAKEKNMGVLFEMAAIAMNQDPSLRLWLVGDGPYRGECAAMVRALGIGDRVKFVGFVPRPDVDPYYEAADLFVFSSITETQGLVVQEAMAYGVPAVAVVGGGASAGIVEGENGFIVRNDPHSFAERVLTVMADDRLHARLGDGASQFVRLHGATEMTDKVLEVYRRVLRLEPERSESATSQRITNG